MHTLGAVIFQNSSFSGNSDLLCVKEALLGFSFCSFPSVSLWEKLWLFSNLRLVYISLLHINFSVKKNPAWLCGFGKELLVQNNNKKQRLKSYSLWQESCNLIQKRLQHRFFPVNIANFFWRTSGNGTAASPVHKRSKFEALESKKIFRSVAKPPANIWDGEFNNNS